MTAISGLGLPPTGIAVHVFRHGPLTAQGHAWIAAHIVLGSIFTVFAVWHVVLNRRALLNHLQGQAAGRPGISREVALAAALVCFALVLTVGLALH